MIPSIIKEGISIPIHAFPDYSGENHYMIEFYYQDGLPKYLKKWQFLVNIMLTGYKDKGYPLYIMIDEGLLHPDTSHRREGLHFDGYWIPDINEDKIFDKINYGEIGNPWRPDEAVILASTVTNSVGYNTYYDSKYTHVGGSIDDVAINTDIIEETLLTSHTVWQANHMMAHKTIPSFYDTPIERQFVRINAPGWKIN